MRLGALAVLILTACASAPVSSPARVKAQAPSKITVLADRSITQSEADVFRKVALDTLRDVGSLAVDISLKAPGEYRESLAAPPGTNFSPSSLGMAPIGGDGGILISQTNIAQQPNTNIALPPNSFTVVPRDSIDLSVTYVIRDASGNVLDDGVEAMRFTNSDHVRSYQNVVDRIAKRVKQLSGS